MRTLKEYLVEAEDYLTKPAVGDVFEIEIARDEMLISGYITECVNDGIVIELDDRGVELLEGYGYVAEAKSALDKIDSRFKSLSGRSMADAAREYGAEAERLQKEIDAQQAEIDRRRMAKDIPFTPDQNTSDKDQFGNVIKHKARHLARKGLSQAGIQKENITVDEGSSHIVDKKKYNELVAALNAARENGDKSLSSDLMDQLIELGGGKFEIDLYGRAKPAADLDEAEYRGRNVPLGKPMQGDVKKFKVYVKKPNGNVVKVNFGDPNMRIKKSNPARRRSFRARHNCDNPGPRWKARYWSCRKW